MTNPVAFARILEYESTLLEPAASLLLEECGLRLEPGARVLVKPNLVNRKNAGLSCTNPLLVRAVCVHLLDCGARVKVADSPAFGSAAQVAKASGLTKALKDLGLPVSGLGRPIPLDLSSGRRISISRDALETDIIVNLPKLKAHCQMRLTGAVKNLFGCVCGFRKALAHASMGDKDNLFPAMIIEVMQALPETVSVLDAVHPMHRTGPIGGDPFELGLVAASASAVALDTAVYTMLGLAPNQVPLWKEAQRRNLPGSSPADLSYPLEKPERFKAEGFILPEKLDSIGFSLDRLLKGRLRSLMHRLSGPR